MGRVWARLRDEPEPPLGRGPFQDGSLPSLSLSRPLRLWFSSPSDSRASFRTACVIFPPLAASSRLGTPSDALVVAVTHVPACPRHARRSRQSRACQASLQRGIWSSTCLSTKNFVNFHGTCGAGAGQRRETCQLSMLLAPVRRALMWRSHLHVGVLMEGFIDRLAGRSEHRQHGPSDPVVNSSFKEKASGRPFLCWTVGTLCGSAPPWPEPH